MPSANSDSRSTDFSFAICDLHLIIRAEVLQILNTRPTQAVEIHLVGLCTCLVNLKLVEECEERLDDESIEKLISIVRAHLPLPKGCVEASISHSDSTAMPVASEAARDVTEDVFDAEMLDAEQEDIGGEGRSTYMQDDGEDAANESLEEETYDGDGGDGGDD
jgi:hypothetical protein